jgi:hypothetical protein
MANRERRGYRAKRKPKKETPKQPVVGSNLGRLPGLGTIKAGAGSKTR